MNCKWKMQGEEIRALKAAKTDAKPALDAAIKELLALKRELAQMRGLTVRS